MAAAIGSDAPADGPTLGGSSRSLGKRMARAVRAVAETKPPGSAGVSLRWGRLEDEALRSGWIVLAYCWMPNQIHALIQTPEPNLASGMQHWLTGTDRVSNLVRRAEHRRRQSSGWRKTVQEIEASLGLNTEHKA
jgi:hypothetical protein